MNPGSLKFFEFGEIEDVGERPAYFPGHQVLGEVAALPAPLDILGESVWSEGNAGSNEVNLQRTLGLGVGGNLDLLRSIADVPDGYSLEFVMREVGDGTGGAMDLVALFKDVVDGTARRRLLVLIDCKNPLPATKAMLSKQVVRAQLLSIPVLANLVLGDEAVPLEVRLIVLAGINPGLPWPLDDAAVSPPRWRAKHTMFVLPRPRLVGFFPVRTSGKLFFVHGPWPSAAAASWGEPWVAAVLKANRQAYKERPRTARADRKEPEWFGAQHELRRGVAVLRPSADDYHSALMASSIDAANDCQRSIRAMRELSAAGKLPPGWEYLGETLDKGKSRLFWRHAGERHDDEALRELVRWFSVSSSALS